jgi:hypothetical protein
MVVESKLKQTKGGRLRKQHHNYVRLDVYKERNEVAIADSSGLPRAERGEVRLYGSISNELHALEKQVGNLHAEPLGRHMQKCEDDPGRSAFAFGHSTLYQQHHCS